MLPAICQWSCHISGYTKASPTLSLQKRPLETEKWYSQGWQATLNVISVNTVIIVCLCHLGRWHLQPRQIQTLWMCVMKFLQVIYKWFTRGRPRNWRCEWGEILASFPVSKSEVSGKMRGVLYRNYMETAPPTKVLSLLNQDLWIYTCQCEVLSSSGKGC